VPANYSLRLKLQVCDGLKESALICCSDVVVVVVVIFLTKTKAEYLYKNK